MPPTFNWLWLGRSVTFEPDVIAVFKSINGVRALDIKKEAISPSYQTVAELVPPEPGSAPLCREKSWVFCL